MLTGEANRCHAIKCTVSTPVPGENPSRKRSNLMSASGSTVSQKNDLLVADTRLVVRFRGQFCYVDAFVEPKLTSGWPPADWPETKKQYTKRLRNTPTHLCRLQYFGKDQWGFGFYTCRHDSYERTFYPDGQILGTPEAAFTVSASMYLGHD